MSSTWNVGILYGIAVLGLLGVIRCQPWRRALACIAVSALAWCAAFQLAFTQGGFPGSPNPAWSMTVCAVSKILGAVPAGLIPTASSPFPGRWATTLRLGLLGGVCGAQMCWLYLRLDEAGCYLGMLGWQLAVTVLLLHGTAPCHDGRSTFWPEPVHLH